MTLQFWFFLTAVVSNTNPSVCHRAGEHNSATPSLYLSCISTPSGFITRVLLCVPLLHYVLSDVSMSVPIWLTGEKMTNLV